MSGSKKDGPTQFELPLFGQDAKASPSPGPRPPPPLPRAEGAPRRFRVLEGGGERSQEKLASRDAVVRVLVASGADLLLRNISPERAGEIERKVDRVLRLFDQVDQAPLLMPVLQRQLDDLEALMGETRAKVSARRSQRTS